MVSVSMGRHRRRASSQVIRSWDGFLEQKEKSKEELAGDNVRWLAPI